MDNYDAESDVAFSLALRGFYLCEATAPGTLFAALSPAVAIRKRCRDCALTPERADCLRQCVRRGPRPRARRRHSRSKRAAGSRDDGSGGDPDPAPPRPLAAVFEIQTPNAASAATGEVRP